MPLYTFVPDRSSYKVPSGYKHFAVYTSPDPSDTSVPAFSVLLITSVPFPPAVLSGCPSAPSSFFLQRLHRKPQQKEGGSQTAFSNIPEVLCCPYIFCHNDTLSYTFSSFFPFDSLFRIPFTSIPPNVPFSRTSKSRSGL